jgi:hypothetical protein
MRKNDRERLFRQELELTSGGVLHRGRDRYYSPAGGKVARRSPRRQDNGHTGRRRRPTGPRGRRAAQPAHNSRRRHDHWHGGDPQPSHPFLYPRTARVEHVSHKG